MSKALKKVSGNIVSLFVLQGSMYILPLILIPVLFRALGPETFGEWVIATSIATMARTVVQYGFDLTAPKIVATNSIDSAIVRTLFSTIVVIRCGLLAIVTLLIVGLSTVSSYLSQVLDLTLLCLLVLLGEILFPVWFFHGIQNMSTVTVLRLGYRVAFVIVVVFVVSSPSDVYLVPLIEATGSLVAGIVATVYASSRFSMPISTPQVSNIWEQLLAGYQVCLSYVAVHFYTTTTTLVLGFSLGSVAVAHYAIAEKLYYAIRGLVGPVVQGFYPHLARLLSEDPDTYWLYAKRLLVGLVFSFALGAALLAVFGEFFVKLLSGQTNEDAVYALMLLALSLPLAVGTLLSSLLVLQEKQSSLLVVTIVTAIANLVIVYPLVSMFGIAGAASTVFVVQAVHVIAHFRANPRVFRVR